MKYINRSFSISGILVIFSVAGMIFSPVNPAEPEPELSAVAAIDPFLRKPYSNPKTTSTRSGDSLKTGAQHTHQYTGAKGGSADAQIAATKSSSGATLAIYYPPTDQGRFLLRVGAENNLINLSQPEQPRMSEANFKPRASFTVTFLLFSSIWLFFYNLSNILNYKKMT